MKTCTWFEKACREVGVQSHRTIIREQCKKYDVEYRKVYVRTPYEYMKHIHNSAMQFYNAELHVEATHGSVKKQQNIKQRPKKNI